MASNNQRAPSAPPPSRWSNNQSKKNSKEHQKLVLDQVKEMFDSILEPEIISSVVQHCKWKLQPSIEALIMLSENAEVPSNRWSQESSSSSSNTKLSKNLNREGRSTEESFTEKRDYKSNLDQDATSTLKVGTTNSYLNLNDKELQRQQEEFRKFELLKKDLTEKGFVPSENDTNVSKPNYYSNENSKIPHEKIQQFGHNWSMNLPSSGGKNDPAKIYFCQDVENSISNTNPNSSVSSMTNQLWANANPASAQKKSKETNNQFDNLFGSKLQFSRDSPNNKIANKGTIPKQSKTPINVASKNLNPSVRQESPSTQSVRDFAHHSVHNPVQFDDSSEDFVESKCQDYAQPQQVAQFDSNYDNDSKVRTSGSKSSLHKGETESLCGLKVQYRLPGLENSSDDDADVVIEEESSDYPTQIPSLMSINVCQFISSSTQSPLENSRPKILTTNTPSPPRSPQRNTFDEKISSINASILNGHKVLIIMRGLPGSGKSHLANTIVKSTVGGDRNQYIFSTDDYFVMLGRGLYHYVRSKLDDAHNYNQKRAARAMEEGVTPVIIDNTNTQVWEMRSYAASGVQYGYKIEVLEPNTPWARNINELAKKNSHGVGKESLRNMIDRYDQNITAAKLIDKFSLRYSAGNPPPPKRNFPCVGAGIQEAEKNEKQKTPSKNRNRKKKKNSNINLDNDSITSQSIDPMNDLLSNLDRNMRHRENSPKENNYEDTLENIVNNALIAENDTLNKSLVDYCIETDSGEEGEEEEIPDAQQKNQTMESDSDLFGERTKSEKRNNCSFDVEEEKKQKKSVSESSNLSSSMNKIPNILQHQNLGAIGSERKGSVTNIDCETLESSKIEDGESTDSSQCWDWVLLVNGKEVNRSCYRQSKYEKDLYADLKKKEVEKKPETKPTSSVVITEIVDDLDLAEFQKDYVIPKENDNINLEGFQKNKISSEDNTHNIDLEKFQKDDISSKGDTDDINLDEIQKDQIASEDTDDIMNKIINKMDASEQEINSASNIEETNKNDAGGSSFGSIFNIIKKSFLGLNSQETPIHNETQSVDSMRYKRQTNDNSLSENDAFENERSHREPNCTDKIILDNENIDEDDDSEFVTIVGDNLSQKLIELDSSSLKESNLENDLREVSKPVTFDMTSSNQNLEFLIDDNLSEKLLEEKKEVIYPKTFSTIKNEKIDSEDLGIDDMVEKANLCREIDDDHYKHEDPIYDILSKAVSRIISRQEKENKSHRDFKADGRTSHSDQEKSDSSPAEFSDLNSKEGIVDEESINIPESKKQEEEIISHEITGTLELAENEKISGSDSEKIIDEKMIGAVPISLENCLENNSDSSIECCEDSAFEICENENLDEESKKDVEEVETANKENQVPVIVDNINQVTWRESPFPVPKDSVNTLIEKIEKLDLVKKSDSSTNTSNYDFNVLYVGGTSEPEYKILKTQSRTINSNTSLSFGEKPPLKWMLDKSSMTSVVDILSGEESLEFRTEVEAMKDLDELVEMFPNIPYEDIQEIYKNLCSCNFNWTVDMLLDGVPEDVTKYGKIIAPKILLGDRTASGSDSRDLESPNSTPHKERLDKLKRELSSADSNESETKLQQQNLIPRKKKDKQKGISEETLELKRQIEEKMVINEACYNPHILKVKRWKNGEPDIPVESKDFKIGGDSEDFVEEMQSPKSSESTDELTEDDIDEEEMMELKLGEDFIEVLENEFGNPEFQFPGGIFPVIQIKKSMAQQLHALWIESMELQLTAQQEQLDNMIEKDAEFARSLEQEEARSISDSLVPNLPEIMDMEMALAIYHNDLKKQIESETPNDMASRLTRQMLHDMFTDYDPETLDEILNAHNGNFKETVEVLEASTGQVVDRNDTLKKQKSLIDRAQKESMQSNIEERPSSSIIVVNPELGQSNNSNSASLTYDAAMQEAEDSRKEAQRHLLLRNENFDKAKEAIRKGNPAVAGYYSQMAKLHAKKREWANSTAASAFLAAQDFKMNANNTLDLHFLYVAEALQALDVFLDFHISRLNEENQKTIHLYIITGRGTRSNRGLSRLKPAVSKKLASKNIRFMDENPGCLKVVLHRRNKTAG